MSRTQAYVNWGRLVADCAQPGCSDAVQLQPGQQAMFCVHGHPSAVEFDDALPAVMAALGERAEERRRNWFPRGHPLAVATGQPHGQSIDDLRAEHTKGVALDEQARAARREQLAAVLGEFGLELGDDGTLRGEMR